MRVREVLLDLEMGFWEASGDLVDLATGAASVTYRATARREGDDDDYAAVISSVYARRDGEWKLMLHQQTPV